jgi:hypothetical protein
MKCVVVRGRRVVPGGRNLLNQRTGYRERSLAIKVLNGILTPSYLLLVFALITQEVSTLVINRT